MKRLIVSVACSTVLAGCVILRTGDHGPVWIGQHANTLVESRGQPDRKMTAPSGATIYVYSRRNFGVCDEQYYVQEGKVVGFMEQGGALNCSGVAGDTK